MYINRWLPTHAHFRPNKEAIVCAETGRRLTYAELYQETLATAKTLRSLGVVAGDRVAILAQNDPRFFILFFAAARIGALLVPLNWRLSKKEQEVLFIYGKFAPESVPAHRQTLHLDSLGQIPATEAEVPEADGLEANSPVGIFYTGGTTGTPKGAMLTHGSVFWNAQNTITGWGLSPEDIAPIFTPLFHIGGVNVFATPLLSLGGTIILSSSFDPDQALELIVNERCSLLFLVPTMYHMVKESPNFDPEKLRQLKMLISGGAACPKPLFQAYWQHGLPLRQGYGLTEAGPNTFGIEQAQAEARVQTVGRPLPYVEVRLHKGDGEFAAPGEVGEIQIRGGHVMAGYWRRPEATSAVLSTDGWLSTGDLAYRDEDGYYTICGRQKEMFISGGENVFPAEIEEVLLGHPHVAEVAVVGVADEKWGEVGRAHLVVREGAPPSLGGSLKDYCRERLAGYKIPKEFRIENELPKSAAGKVLKTELAQR